MPDSLRVLIVEDSDDDAEMLLRELRRSYAPVFERVYTEATMRAALAKPWDIVISDWSMPELNGLEAFRLTRELGLDMPFFIVSGTIEEESAVSALRAGVHDFIVKGRFARLQPSITRELREAANRRHKREADAEVARQRELLVRNEDRYRSIFENSPLPMWTFDRETLRFVSVNEAAQRHYGYSREEFAAMTIADIRPPEELPALRSDVAKAIGRVDPRIWRHQKKDGTQISVEVSANDITVDGRSVRLVLVNDVTERERAQRELRKTEEQLRHSQKMDALGLLAGGVAHDFNNILTVIHSFSNFLEEALDPADARRGDATEIRRAAERGAAITKQLLTLSRHSIVTPRSLKLDEVITGFTPMLKRLVGEQVSLSTPKSDVPSVIADQGQIEQVLMNLAVNARDAMPAGGRLTIETTALDVDEATVPGRGLKTGRYVVLAVTDTGTGMDADTQRQIFDPFFTTKEAGKGTGLGLSIVHGIAVQAGGTVTVYSELGHGTTFRVLLPVATESVSVASREEVAPPRTLPPITVLVVDDHRDVRGVATRVLKEAGCNVLEGATAEEARQICVSHEGPIDLVIIDVVLADGRGDLVVRQLRELRPSIATILMSGYPAGALTTSGGVPPELLAKPFSPAELRAAVARCLDLDSSSRATPATPKGTAETGRTRILLVDDDPELRRTLARLLKRAEFEVVDAGTGREALAALESRSFDAILSDVHMPDGGGLDLLRAVRRLDLDVPVVLMSGEPSVQAAAAAIEYGAFRYLTKPVDSGVLCKLLQHAARAHSLARIRREAFSIAGNRTGAADRAGLEVRFEKAFDGMWMAFQPIFDASGALYGVEALVRSHEPSMPGPQHILDAATQLGRLPLVGRRVRALSAAALATRSDLTLFVNLHPEDLDDIELVNDDAPLTKIASSVVLEVTERASLSTSAETSARIARLRALGFRLAVDDIGAGYSGLTSFTSLTPEIVKIDMSLVRDVHLSALKQRTIAALCRLCHEVGCKVVGEGVETIDERDCLVGLGCDLLQGFLLGRPSAALPAAG